MLTEEQLKYIEQQLNASQYLVNKQLNKPINYEKFKQSFWDFNRLARLAIPELIQAIRETRNEHLDTP